MNVREEKQTLEHGKTITSNLFDSISKNDKSQSIIYRNALEQSALKAQEEFATMKKEMQDNQKRRTGRMDENNHTILKRDLLDYYSSCPDLDEIMEKLAKIEKRNRNEHLYMIGFLEAKILLLHPLERAVWLYKIALESYNVTKNRCESYHLLMGVRIEFENELMDDLYPKSLPKVNSPYLKCLFVLLIQKGNVAKKYRKVITDAGFTIEEFCKDADSQIYGPKFRIVHTVRIPSHCLTQDNYMNIVRDDPLLLKFINQGKRKELIALLLALRDIRLSNMDGFNEGSRVINQIIVMRSVQNSPYICEGHDLVDTGECILLSNVPFQKVLENNQLTPRCLPEEQIKTTFLSRETKYMSMQFVCETKESNTVRDLNGRVLIRFDTGRKSALAMIHHKSQLNGNDITFSMVNCTRYECAEEGKWTRPMMRVVDSQLVNSSTTASTLPSEG